MDRNNGEQPLCGGKSMSSLPLMTPLSSAANMRSGHTEAFVHNHSRPWTSAPRLTLTGTNGALLCSCNGPHASTFLSPFPWCGFAFRPSRGFRPLRYYGDSDSCTAHLPCRSPRLLRHTFAVVPSPTTWAAWTSLTTTPACPASFGLRLGIAGSSQLPAESSSFSYGPTLRLRLLSTPPHSDAVTFGYGVVASSDTDFHRADVAPSRAHDSGFRRNDDEASV
jgi:hypothetical protein